VKGHSRKYTMGYIGELGQLKNPVASSGIELMAFLLVA
jgi:hypothetical protein